MHIFAPHTRVLARSPQISSPSQAKAWQAWHGVVWYGVLAFSQTCSLVPSKNTCFPQNWGLQCSLFLVPLHCQGEHALLQKKRHSPRINFAINSLQLDTLDDGRMLMHILSPHTCTLSLSSGILAKARQWLAWHGMVRYGVLTLSSDVSI